MIKFKLKYATIKLAFKNFEQQFCRLRSFFYPRLVQFSCYGLVREGFCEILVIIFKTRGRVNKYNFKTNNLNFIIFFGYFHKNMTYM